MSKHQHLDTVEAKLGIMNHEIKLFIESFSPLCKKCLPLFWEEKGRMFSQKEYHDHLIECRLDHRKFEDMHQSLKGKVIVDKLADDFEIIFSFKTTCAHIPYFSFIDHVEMRVLVKEMASLDLPSVDQ